MSYYVTWQNERTGKRTVSLSPIPLADLHLWTSPSERAVALQAAL
jgi:hypothetical protein